MKDDEKNNPMGYTVVDKYPVPTYMHGYGELELLLDITNFSPFLNVLEHSMEL